MSRGYLWRRALLILVTASFAINLGFSALSPVFPYLVLALKGMLKKLPELTAGVIEAHKGAVEFGLLIAVFMATRAPVAGVAGVLGDIFGKKRTILIGMLLYLLASIGFYESNNMTSFLIFRAIQGVASGMVWPVAEAYLADVTPRWSRGKVMSIYSASLLVSDAVGPAIGVGVYKLYIKVKVKPEVLEALKSPILLLIALSVLSIGMLYFIPEVLTKASKGESIAERFRVVKSLLKSMPRDTARSIKVIFANGVINGFAIGVLGTSAVVYIIEKIAKNPSYIGLFYTILSAAAIPSALIGGYVSDKLNRRKPLVIIGYLIGDTGFFIIPLVHTYTMLLLVAVALSAIVSFAVPIMRALQADITPEGIRGSIFGVQQLMFNTGAMIGSIAGGALTKKTAPLVIHFMGKALSGYIVPFWLTGSLTISTLILFALLVKEPR